MAEEDRATTPSIKIPSWDGTEGEKAQMHVTKLESAAELGGYAEALEMSYESALPTSETQTVQTDDEKKAAKLNKKARSHKACVALKAWNASEKVKPMNMQKD